MGVPSTTPDPVAVFLHDAPLRTAGTPACQARGPASLQKFTPLKCFLISRLPATFQRKIKRNLRTSWSSDSVRDHHVQRVAVVGSKFPGAASTRVFWLRGSQGSWGLTGDRQGSCWNAGQFLLRRRLSGTPSLKCLLCKHRT